MSGWDWSYCYWEEADWGLVSSHVRDLIENSELQSIRSTRGIINYRCRQANPLISINYHGAHFDMLSRSERVREALLIIYQTIQDLEMEAAWAKEKMMMVDSTPSPTMRFLAQYIEIVRAQITAQFRHGEPTWTAWDPAGLEPSQTARRARSRLGIQTTTIPSGLSTGLNVGSSSSDLDQGKLRSTPVSPIADLQVLHYSEHFEPPEDLLPMSPLVTSSPADPTTTSGSISSDGSSGRTESESEKD